MILAITATQGMVIVGALGLFGTVLAAVLTRRTGAGEVEVARDATANATIQLALTTQAAQLDRQETRIAALEDDVTTCHRERDDDRRQYRAELDELRAQIGAPPP